MTTRQRLSCYGYLVCVALFVVGILTQVFFVGLSLLGQRPSWEAHTGLGHSLAGFAIVMVILAHTGAFPYSIKRLTWLNLGLYILLADVVIFMRGSAPIVAALHPVLAVMLFAIASTLALKAGQAVRELRMQTMQVVPETV